MTTNSHTTDAREGGGATPRRLSHRRNIELKGYCREDGLYDIEAELIDTKGIPLTTPDRPVIAVGEELHRMILRLSVDATFVIREVEARMEQTPYHHCPEIAEAYQQLVGVSIGAGWTRAIKNLFGGEKGCTHLRELLGPMATVAFQTIVDEECRTKDYRESENVFRSMIGSCHGLRADGETVKELWPELINNPQETTQ